VCFGPVALAIASVSIGAVNRDFELSGLAGTKWDNVLHAAVTRPDPAQDAEAAIKALREARDPEAKRRAADALQKALDKLREQLK
jgi:hypothetical protein